MCTFAEGSKFSCTESVQSCDEVAPQSHEVFTHCALNPAMMKNPTKEERGGRETVYAMANRGVCYQ